MKTRGQRLHFLGYLSVKHIKMSLVYLALALSYPYPAWSEVFNVSGGDVNGLWDAINTANANDEPDTINLEAGTYSVVDHTPGNALHFSEITSQITILGAGHASTIIERQTEFGFNFFYIDSSGDLTLSDLTLTGGTTGNSCGGAITMLPEGKLSIQNCTISNNNSDFAGGAICNLGGSIFISNSTFAENVAKNQGGAIENKQTSILTITNSTFKGNKGGADGGAIHNSKSELNITDSSFFENSAGGDGGGISSKDSDSTVNIMNSTIHDNAASINGGGVEQFDGQMTITRSTISNNTADLSGGGFSNTFGRATIKNSTISGNSAINRGGGIDSPLDFSRGNVGIFLNNVTITFNVADSNGDGIGNGGGIFNGEFSSIVFLNTIIANNSGTDGASDCFGSFNSQGYNLIQVLSPECVIAGVSTGNIIGENPLLAPLANNGGLTETHALATNSPAVDTGNPAPPGSGGGACELTDQRDVSKPQGTACDIGAYELDNIFTDGFEQ
jgi:predicted outer membrane repeat protein